MDKISSDLKKIGEMIKKVRKEKKISQAVLSEITNIPRSTIARYESGRHQITEENKVKIYEALHIKNRENLSNDSIESLILYQKKMSLSLDQLAKKVGVSKASLSYAISGKRSASKSMIDKINSFLSSSSNKVSLSITKNNGNHIFPSVNKEDMGKRIHQIRINREESLQAFGKQFSQPTGKNVVSRWENGINVPDIERLMNIAHLGETTVTFLLYGDYYRNMLKKDNSINSFAKMNSSNLGMRLRKIRKEKRLEREEFGREFTPKITKWSMDRYENGRDIPNSERLLQYAYLGEVSLSFLVYGI